MCEYFSVDLHMQNYQKLCRIYRNIQKITHFNSFYFPDKIKQYFRLLSRRRVLMILSFFGVVCLTLADQNSWLPDLSASANEDLHARIKRETPLAPNAPEAHFRAECPYETDSLRKSK